MVDRGWWCFGGGVGLGVCPANALFPTTGILVYATTTPDPTASEK